MPRETDKLLYDKAVQWINENPHSKRISKKTKQDFLLFDALSSEKKSQLINTLLKMTELPEVMKHSLPWLTGSMEILPTEVIQMIGVYLNEPERKNLACTSKRMRSVFFPPQKELKEILNKLLSRVAYGEQDKVEKLFTEVYTDKAGNRKEDKIQQALRYQGTFTDYSGRTFNCTAYEYAYWAKDTHMCRMLERYMDDDTKAELLARVNEIERTGLSYTQHGVAYCTHHFDLTPLIQALQSYVDNFHAWYVAGNLDAIQSAWMNVGLAQRDVPAHVAQEYCRRDRAFDPRPLFNEPALPRILTFYNWTTSQKGSWFPLTAPDNPLGFYFAFIRGSRMRGRGPARACPGVWAADSAGADLVAISHLDKVRTAYLTLSREHLNPPARSHCPVM